MQRVRGAALRDPYFSLVSVTANEDHCETTRGLVCHSRPGLTCWSDSQTNFESFSRSSKLLPATPSSDLLPVAETLRSSVAHLGASFLHSTQAEHPTTGTGLERKNISLLRLIPSSLSAPEPSAVLPTWRVVYSLFPLPSFHLQPSVLSLPKPSSKPRVCLPTALFPSCNLPPYFNRHRRPRFPPINTVQLLLFVFSSFFR